MVPDAVVFVNDNSFLLSMTEQQNVKQFYFLKYLVTQKNQHSKILVYFFVFESSRKDNTQVSKRLMNFLEYVNEVEVEGVTGHDMLKRKNISLFSQNNNKCFWRYCRNHSRKDVFKS